MVEILSRFQFASVAVTHALLLSLSLGGAIVLAVLQTSAMRRNDDELLELVRWWGGLYVVNYVVGIGAGMLLELQFGLGFPGLVDRAGNVVGATFAIETLTTFVVESTALAAWIFGFAVLSRRVHVMLIWVVCASALLSVFWALLANGFLQRPEGYVIRDGQIVLTNPWAVLSGPELWTAMGHVTGAALTAAGFAMAGTSAWWLLRATREGSASVSVQGPAFVASARIGLLTGAGGALLAVVLGVASLNYLEEVQPAKRAALLAPGGDSSLIDGLAEIYGPGSWTPPGWIIIPFVVMVLSGVTLLAVAVVSLSGDVDYLNDPPESPAPAQPKTTDTVDAPDGLGVRIPFSRRTASILIWIAPLPLLTIASGWLVREVGRQPWVVTGLLTTADAVSDRTAAGAAAMLAFVVTICVALLVVDAWLLSGMVRRSFEWQHSRNDPSGRLAEGATLLDAHANDAHEEAK